MLMPTPGSPERFQESLVGQLPSNFDKPSPSQQACFRQAQPFAAQRGLIKDEVAGLFGTINKRDYMVGMKDLLMELYDCPDRSSKETQSGVTIVEKAALSILGVTTPAGLATAVSEPDWVNGLLVRFTLLTPEPDYAERPSAKQFQAPPPRLIEGLRALHEKLPAPQSTEQGLTAPPALALDWLEMDALTPTLTPDHWQVREAIAETWRASAHRLLEQMDWRGEATHERRQQDTLLTAILLAGMEGVNLRTLYCHQHLTAQRVRLLAQELARAGLVIEQRVNGIEWYVASEYTAHEVIG
jgi:hypothetical protein